MDIKKICDMKIDTESLPGIITITPTKLDLNISGLTKEHNKLKHMLHTDGALLLRDFNINSADKFKDLAVIFANDLSSDNGEHNPVENINGIYTPISYTPEEKLLWHNENSFNQTWPLMIMFCAANPADHGGETPIVNSRKVLAELDEEVINEFNQKGVMYVRTHGSSFGRSWQELYKTNSKLEVEKKCKENNIQTYWSGENQLITKQIRPALVKHPITNQLSWFNQAQHWHPYCLNPEVRTYLEELSTADTLPRNCFFGDGSVISDDIMQHILDTYQKLEISFPWQKNDVMVLDNVLFAHARNPYSGKRKLLVTMGNHTSFPD